jgi:hypothetical protein
MTESIIYCEMRTSFKCDYPFRISRLDSGISKLGLHQLSCEYKEGWRNESKLMVTIRKPCVTL